MTYTLPRDVFSLLEEAFNHDKKKTEIFVKAIEESIQAIDDKAYEVILEKKDQIKSEFYNVLRTELAIKEFVRAENSELRAQINQIGFMLKILIGIAVFGLTLFNPAFVKLVELVMK